MRQQSNIHSWSSDNAVNFYIAHRDTSENLYRSEKVFLQETLQDASTVLDVGCAAGGFSKIVREYNRGIHYTGVDISPRMIQEAGKRFPGERFSVTDGNCLAFPDNAFDAVLCFGVLHMTENWKTLLAEAWRVCADTLLVDLRITGAEGISDPAVSYQKLEFEGAWDGVSKAPYIVVNIDDLMRCLTGLQPAIATLKGYGYMHPVSPMTVSRFHEVCMAALSLHKQGNHPLTIAGWDMPIMPTRKNIRDLIALQNSGARS
jgi:SAM-dependent methyltransferase